MDAPSSDQSHSPSLEARSESSSRSRRRLSLFCPGSPHGSIRPPCAIRSMCSTREVGGIQFGGSSLVAEASEHDEPQTSEVGCFTLDSGLGQMALWNQPRSLFTSSSSIVASLFLRSASAKRNSSVIPNWEAECFFRAQANS